MSKKRKSPVSVVWSDIYDRIDRDWTVAEVAEDLGCSTATIYRALKQRKDGVKTPTVTTRAVPALSLEVRLPETGPVKVKVKNGGGTLCGTLTLTDAGINYRRPNQKGGADHNLSWDTLCHVIAMKLSIT